MRLFSPSRLAVLLGVGLFGSPASVRAADYDFVGAVIFTNIQSGLGLGADVPYFGVGFSPLTGPCVQTGSIRPTSVPTPVGPTTLRFTGVVGAHPLLGDNVHVISTLDGQIFCTWTATFTITFTDTTGTVGVFSGDGAFTVTGGTGKYKKASGTFRTLFATGPIPLSSDSAIATVTQKGKIKR